MHQHVLADRQRILGNDHPDTMKSQTAISRLVATRTDSAKPNE
jgi:hypothetical protein